MFYGPDLTHLFVHKDCLRGKRTGEALFSQHCKKERKHSQLLLVSFKMLCLNTSVFELCLWKVWWLKVKRGLLKQNTMCPDAQKDHQLIKLNAWLESIKWADGLKQWKKITGWFYYEILQWNPRIWPWSDCVSINMDNEPDKSPKLTLTPFHQASPSASSEPMPNRMSLLYVSTTKIWTQAKKQGSRLTTSPSWAAQFCLYQRLQTKCTTT